eukprot:3416762-Amphidinium_carterae.4
MCWKCNEAVLSNPHKPCGERDRVRIAADARAQHYSGSSLAELTPLECNPIVGAGGPIMDDILDILTAPSPVKRSMPEPSRSDLAIPTPPPKVLRQENTAVTERAPDACPTWCSWLRSTFAEHKKQIGDQHRAIRVQSLCSGMGTDHVTMQAISSANRRLLVTARLIIIDGHESKACIYSTVADVVDGVREGRPVKCLRHGSCQPQRRADMLVAGFPCAPFSTQRPGRMSGGDQRFACCL